MRLRQVPARRGAAWVRHGFSVFARRPLAFAALFTAFLFAALVAALLPLVGPLQGRMPTLAVFVTPLRRDRRVALALLKLGLAYAAATLAVMALSDIADGGTFRALEDAMAGSRGAADGAGRSETAALLGDPRLLGGMLLRLTLISLLALPFWHAPGLAYWAGQGVGQALFSSTLACWRNRGAFAVYGLVWAGVAFGFGIVANVAAALIAHPQLIALAAVPAGLLFSTVFYVSLYFTFADCFEAGAAAPPDAEGAPKS